MRCIRCSINIRNQERLGVKCPRCGEPFAFTPGIDKITDRKFQAAIAAVSADTTLVWNLDHLYYEVCRRMTRHKRLVPKARRQVVPLSKGGLNGMWEKWTAAHGLPPAPSRLTQATVPPAPWPAPSDVGDYSVDEVVVCDRPETADVFINNLFHVDNRCAVVSVDGHPAGVFPVIMDMLRRNPRFRVLVVHDATPAGCALAHQLADDSRWFKREVLAHQATILDVGLRPSQAGPYAGCYLRASGRPALLAPIGEDEAKWLRRYALELAVVRPANLLGTLQRVLRRDPGDTFSQAMTQFWVEGGVRAAWGTVDDDFG